MTKRATKVFWYARATFTRANLYGSWTGERERKTGDFWKDVVSMCSDGPHDWFHLPTYCKRLYVCISNNPAGGYLLHRNPYWHLKEEGPNGHTTGFLSSMGRWFNDLEALHPDSPMYLSIEVDYMKETPRGKRKAKR